MSGGVTGTSGITGGGGYGTSGIEGKHKSDPTRGAVLAEAAAGGDRTSLAGHRMMALQNFAQAMTKEGAKGEPPRSTDPGMKALAKNGKLDSPDQLQGFLAEVQRLSGDKKISKTEANALLTGLNLNFSKGLGSRLKGQGVGRLVKVVAFAQTLFSDTGNVTKLKDAADARAKARSKARAGQSTRRGRSGFSRGVPKSQSAPAVVTSRIADRTRVRTPSEPVTSGTSGGSSRIDRLRAAGATQVMAGLSQVKAGAEDVRITTRVTNTVRFQMTPAVGEKIQRTLATSDRSLGVPEMDVAPERGTLQIRRGGITWQGISLKKEMGQVVTHTERSVARVEVKLTSAYKDRLSKTHGAEAKATLQRQFKESALRAAQERNPDITMEDLTFVDEFTPQASGTTQNASGDVEAHATSSRFSTEEEKAEMRAIIKEEEDFFRQSQDMRNDLRPGVTVARDRSGRVRYKLKEGGRTMWFPEGIRPNSSGKFIDLKTRKECHVLEHPKGSGKLAALPEGWQAAKADDGQQYFFHVETRESSWSPPDGTRYAE